MQGLSVETLSFPSLGRGGSQGGGANEHPPLTFVIKYVTLRSSGKARETPDLNGVY